METNLFSPLTVFLPAFQGVFHHFSPLHNHVRFPHNCITTADFTASFPWQTSGKAGFTPYFPGRGNPKADFNRSFPEKCGPKAGCTGAFFT